MEQLMPNSRVESYRFTDLTPLLQQQLQTPPATDAAAAFAAAAERCTLPAAEGSRVVFVDGVFCEAASDLSSLSDGVYVGPAASAPAAAASSSMPQAQERGGVFAALNAATASSRVVVHVAEGVHYQTPLHVVYLASSAREAGSAVASAPQLLVAAEAGAQLEIVEEFVGAQNGGQGTSYTNAVMEATLAKGAKLEHRVVESEEAGAFHIKGTYVRQDEGSEYALVEARLGGALTRCDFWLRAPLAGCLLASASCAYLALTYAALLLHCASGRCLALK